MKVSIISDGTQFFVAQSCSVMATLKEMSKTTKNICKHSLTGGDMFDLGQRDSLSNTAGAVVAAAPTALLGYACG